MNKKIKMLLVVILICTLVGNVLPGSGMTNSVQAKKVELTIPLTVGQSEYFEFAGIKKIKSEKTKIATVKKVGKKGFKVKAKKKGNTYLKMTYKNGTILYFRVKVTAK